MKLFKSEKVAGTASIETTTTLITGTAAAPKHVERLIFTEYTAGGEQHDATVRVYKDTVKIAEFYLYHFLNAFDSDTKLAVGEIPLDVALAEGEKLEVGHLSGGTASDIAYTAQYEEARR